MATTDFNELWATFQQKIGQLQRAGMEEFTEKLQSAVDEMLEFSMSDQLMSQYEANPSEIIDIINNGIEQIFDRNSVEIAAIVVEYANEIGIAAADIAGVFNISPGRVAEIVDFALDMTQMNNFDYIRQITPQLHNDIMQAFSDGVSNGLHPNMLIDNLLEVGLPWSPTGQFSPGERAGMIAYTEFARISEAMSDQLRSQANIQHCVNMLNPLKEKHADICLAATMAGLITVIEMVKKYLRPPRHPNCGCSLRYLRPAWYNNETEKQIARLKSENYDIETQMNRWNDPEKGGGSIQVQNQRNQRKHKEWENNVMERAFGEAA